MRKKARASQLCGQDCDQVDEIMISSQDCDQEDEIMISSLVSKVNPSHLLILLTSPSMAIVL
jgi:hypothetical protein